MTVRLITKKQKNEIVHLTGNKYSQLIIYKVGVTDFKRNNILQ